MFKLILTALVILTCSVLSCGETTIIQGDNPGVISTVAGGAQGVAETGSVATEVTIVKPYQVIALSAGDFYILETEFNRLLYVDSRGQIEKIAGSSTAGFSGDGGNARDALLYAPAGFGLDHDGSIYIADTSNHRVRKIDTAGIITTIAGSNLAGFDGDGGPATEARLYEPRDVAIDPTGRIYISDYKNNRIRMVDLDGTIQTICGSDNYTFNGNGIPSVEANLFKPLGLDVDPQGDLYIAVSGHHMIRKIDNAGIISTVAGSGIPGFSGDGDDAVRASLYYPHDVYIREDGGGFYIADYQNHRIRFVDINGTMFTVAGNGEPGYNGDGLFATDASLNFPSGVSVDVFDNLYIADTSNFRIRRVPFPTVASDGSGGEGTTESARSAVALMKTNTPNRKGLIPGRSDLSYGDRTEGDF